MLCEDVEVAAVAARPRPLIVGMNNPLSDDPEHALYPHPDGCTGHRIWRMLEARTGATRRDYLRVFERINLVAGRYWDRKSARGAARKLRAGFAGRHVVLLGREVQDAFEMPLMTPGELVIGSGPDAVTFHAMPHPSGRNTWYNYPENRQSMCDLLARLYNDYARLVDGESTETDR